MTLQDAVSSSDVHSELPDSLKSGLLARLQAALTPEYRIEREIAAGGMGIVFRAHDVSLGRAVAIKVIRPELATARMVERFTHEARLLANLNHPGIVPVYSAGEADGLFYFVMPFIEGVTLAQRLERGPLSVSEIRRIGLDLLDTLAAAHRVDVVHRDISLRNVFLVDGRALVADFGIAATSDDAQNEHAMVGTIGAMPPEQATGGVSTPATDVYAVAALLYSALTGRSWVLTDHPKAADWRHVPRPLARVLWTALAWEPSDRYADASAFARALQRSNRRPLLIAATLSITIAVTLAVLMLLNRSDVVAAPISDLAVLPFEAERGTAGASRDLARLVTMSLEGVPGLSLTPTSYVFRWADAQRGNRTPNYAELRANYHVRGSLVRVNQMLAVRVQLFERENREARAVATFAFSGNAEALLALSDSIALAVLRRLHPALANASSGLTPMPTRDVDALLEFLNGQSAFERGAWLTANRHFSAAVVEDSTFILAWWRLLNTWRWMPTVISQPMLSPDLASLYKSYGAKLPELERLLVEAELAPPGLERLHKLEAAAQRFPNDDYAALLLGVEFWHRGALSGFPLTRALAELQRAIALNRYLNPAQENVAWAAIRLGDRQLARQALDEVARFSPAPAEVDVYTPAFFELAYAARFDPAYTTTTLQRFFDYGSDASLKKLRFGVRAGLMVALPHTQRMVARLLLDSPAATASDSSDAYEALGLAELAQGYHEQGFAHLDSAAATSQQPESELELAEWQTFAPLLGWPRVTPQRARSGRAALARLSTQPATATRAQWAMLVADLISGRSVDTRAIERFRVSHRDDAYLSLAIMLDALHAASRHDYARAQRISQASLPYDSHGRHGDPFGRAVLHLQRARWDLAIGQRDAAERELLWAENVDVVGWPSGTAQSAEVDWVFAVYALLRRSQLARDRGDLAQACSRLREASYFLQGAPLPFEVSSAGCDR